MIEKMKHGYQLYHSTYVSKKFKRAFILELLFWFIVGYCFCCYNANTISEAGVSIAKEEHIVSMLIKILLPLIIYVLLLGYTQGPIYHFLEENTCVTLYKMFPNSFKNFKHNLIMTYVIASIGVLLFCILYMLLFCPTYLVFALYEFSLLLPISAFIIYRGLRKKGSFMIWNIMSPMLMLLVSGLCMVANEKFYGTIQLHTMLSLCFYALCVFITFRIVNKIICHMKGVWWK